jgi:Ferredoxin subunits of nitrite reductase and ring-hydroxylating dioxygenases
MNDPETNLSGPDFAAGIALSKLIDGAMLLGQAHDEPVLLARRENEVFAIGASCTHYGAPLADGLLVGDTVRCPWHHACFSLRNGAALRAPALDPVSCWRVEQLDGSVYVREKLARTEPKRLALAAVHRNARLSWAVVPQATRPPRRSVARAIPDASSC